MADYDQRPMSFLRLKTDWAQVEARFEELASRIDGSQLKLDSGTATLVGELDGRRFSLLSVNVDEREEGREPACLGLEIQLFDSRVGVDAGFSRTPFSRIRDGELYHIYPIPTEAIDGVPDMFCKEKIAALGAFPPIREALSRMDRELVVSYCHAANGEGISVFRFNKSLWTLDLNRLRLHLDHMESLAEAVSRDALGELFAPGSLERMDDLNEKIVTLDDKLREWRRISDIAAVSLFLIGIIVMLMKNESGYLGTVSITTFALLTACIIFDLTVSFKLRRDRKQALKQKPVEQPTKIPGR